MKENVDGWKTKVVLKGILQKGQRKRPSNSISLANNLLNISISKHQR